jgi:hypothetical protein
MKKQIFAKTNNKGFVFVDCFSALRVSKQFEETVCTDFFNCFYLEDYIAIAKERIPYDIYSYVLEAVTKGEISLIEDNAGFVLFKAVKKKDDKILKSTKKLVYDWSVSDSGSVTVYKNKKDMKGRGYLFFADKKMTVGTTKEKSSFVVFFGKDKVWKKNAGYVQINGKVVEIILVAESGYKPFNIYPFVAFYDKEGNKIKTMTSVKLKIGEQGTYKLYFKQNQNSVETPFCAVPKGAVSLGIGFNFYKDKGFFNVEKLEIFRY